MGSTNVVYTLFFNKVYFGLIKKFEFEAKMVQLRNNQMKKNLLTKCIYILCVVILSSCETYHLSTQSLLTQFAETQTETKVNFIFAYPLFFPGVVTGNNLRGIMCLDKNDQKVILNITNHTGVRITKKDGKRKTFYFDTLLIKDSVINGAESHFFGLTIKPIKLNEIEKIELQK